jgi:hypothetical protein
MHFSRVPGFEEALFYGTAVDFRHLFVGVQHFQKVNSRKGMQQKVPTPKMVPSSVLAFFGYLYYYTTGAFSFTRGKGTKSTFRFP